MESSLHRSRVTIASLALATVLLYLPGIDWGAPTATGPDRIKTYATDEILPLEGLAEMRNTFVHSREDRNYGYPWWHYFVVASAQAPYLAYLKVSGGMSRPEPNYPFGLRDPVGSLRGLTIVGRLVSVLMAAGIVAAAYGFGTTLWDHPTGLVAALITLTNFLLVYYGRTGNLDAPVTFWTSLGLVAFGRIMVAGLTPKRAAALGLFAGLAMATKDQAFLVFAPLAVALLFPRFSSTPDRASRTKAIVAGLVASLVSYAIATGMVVDPVRHITHVRALLFDPMRVAPGTVYFPPAPRTLAGRLGLVADFVVALGEMMSWPVVVFSLIGAFLAARSRPRLLVLLVPLLALFLGLVLPTGGVVRRYLLPNVLITSAFAAFGLVRLGRSGRPLLATALLALTLVWQLGRAIDLVAAQQRETRTAAGRWLATHVNRGERLEYFGTSDVLPPLSPEVVTRRIAGRTDWVGETGHGPAILEYLGHEGPEWIVSVPDWSSQPDMDHSADCPTVVCDALRAGTAGYAEVAYFAPCRLLPGPFRRPRLDNPSVCPPVRIFARRDLLPRIRPS